MFEPLEPLFRREIRLIELQSLSVRSGRTRRVTLLLQRQSEVTVRFRRVRDDSNRAPEILDRVGHVTSLQREATLGDVQSRILLTVAGGNEVAPFLDLRGRLVFA